MFRRRYRRTVGILRRLEEGLPNGGRFGRTGGLGVRMGVLGRRTMRRLRMTLCCFQRVYEIPVQHARLRKGRQAGEARSVLE